MYSPRESNLCYLSEQEQIGLQAHDLHYLQKKVYACSGLQPPKASVLSVHLRGVLSRGIDGPVRTYERECASLCNLNQAQAHSILLRARLAPQRGSGSIRLQLAVFGPKLLYTASTAYSSEA